MRAVIVDDEPIMIRSFLRNTAGIEDFAVVAKFEDPQDACDYLLANPVDAVFLDIEMPGMNGMELAGLLKAAQPDLLIVFITAYENYIKESNALGADYYIVKPYTPETMEQVISRLRRLLPDRKDKEIFLQTFGRFILFKNGQPVPLVGKTKEILALITSRRGREISNEELYTTIWEGRAYDNIQMKVYYNALRRLRDTLEKAGIPDLILSTARGQLLNTAICDCDYIAWLEGRPDSRSTFEGEFLTEYTWAEPLLADLLEM